MRHRTFGCFSLWLVFHFFTSFNVNASGFVFLLFLNHSCFVVSAQMFLVYLILCCLLVCLSLLSVVVVIYFDITSSSVQCENWHAVSSSNNFFPLVFGDLTFGLFGRKRFLWLVYLFFSVVKIFRRILLITFTFPFSESMRYSARIFIYCLAVDFPLKALLHLFLIESSDFVFFCSDIYSVYCFGVIFESLKT